MIYESIGLKFSVTLSHGELISFTRRDWEVPGGALAFGEFDSNDSKTQKRCGKTAEQLEQIIERTEMFRRQVVGKFGVWRQEDRIKADHNHNSASLMEGELRNFLDSELLLVCSNLNIPIQPDAPRNDIVVAILQEKEARGLRIIDITKAALQPLVKPAAPVVPTQEAVEKAVAKEQIVARTPVKPKFAARKGAEMANTAQAVAVHE